MDKRVDRTVALLSIHPTYARRLLDKTKSVELRKTKLCKDVRYVVIYSTSPVQKIVGYFSVAQITVDLPSKIWSKYSQTSGIKRTDFFSYYKGSKQSVAIEVDQVYKLCNPTPLSILGSRIKPPQSFQYLNYSSIIILKKYVSDNYPEVA